MACIVITEFMDEGAVARLSDAAETVYDPALVEQPDKLAGLLADARALIVRNRTQVREPILRAAPNLNCVGRLGVGLDNIDMAACDARAVAVYPATGANDASVAEYVITASMMLLRGAYLGSDQVRNGAWPRQSMMGAELGGRCLGLVGYGAIARETAARARALGMRIAAFDPHLPADHPAWVGADRLELNELLAVADIVSLHTPLTDETRHLINGEALSRMKRSAIVINAARGGIVDETALTDALSQGALAGAALDVFETEPMTEMSGAKFAGLNVLLTPHIAGVTTDSNIRVSHLIADKVLAHLNLT